ncbi:hypothetical protein niasHT_004080 [Heterodera trifolii]|uniref:EF-hand domain-containing protein n=1 Tax=Heterodera trifolii TaxID=157864 RepID=A0ABD2LSW4_9BILA
MWLEGAEPAGVPPRLSARPSMEPNGNKLVKDGRRRKNAIDLKEANKQIARSFQAAVKGPRVVLAGQRSKKHCSPPEDYGRPRTLASIEKFVEKKSINCWTARNPIRSHMPTAVEEYEPTGRDALARDSADVRREKLNKAITVHQFLRDIDEEESWIKEKKLLVSSDDYGRDLAGVQNLRRKHRRFGTELDTHKPQVEVVRSKGLELAQSSEIGVPEIERRIKALEQSWTQMVELAEDRHKKLQESEEFQNFIGRVEEEEAWLNEKQTDTQLANVGENIAAVQGLLKKHDTSRVNSGGAWHGTLGGLQDWSKRETLINSGNHHAKNIGTRTEQLLKHLILIKELAVQRLQKLRDNNAYMQFMWKCDVVESWIGDKEPHVRSADFGRDLSSVQLLVNKQDIDNGLNNFEHEGIQRVTELKDQLLEAEHEQSAAIEQRHRAVIQRWQQLLANSLERRRKLNEAQAHFKQIEDLYLTFAKKASAFNSWFENAEEDLTDPVRCNSLEEIRALREAHTEFQKSLVGAEDDFRQLQELDRQIKSYNVGPNPYTWFTIEALSEGLGKICKSSLLLATAHSIIKERELELQKEHRRQEDNDKLRREFARQANEFHQWLADTRGEMMEASGSLEQQLDTIRRNAQDIKAQRAKLKKVEDLGALLEEHLILDNRYTEHSTVGLAQAWDQLDQLAMRMQHNLEQQIQARNQSGVSEEALREFSMMFRHFDREKLGRLDHQQFKSCLRALGYDLPMVDEGQPEPEFQRILDVVDPNRDGYVTLQEFMAFMINKETENVRSSDEIEMAFRALSKEYRPYVFAEELFANLTQEQAQYCKQRMKPYVDAASGRTIENALDFEQFVHSMFMN